MKLFRTLFARLSATVAVVAVMCLVMLAMISYLAIGSIERARLQASIRSDVTQIEDRLRREYLSIMHLSQQMMPEGNIGTHLNDYLNSESRYDKITSSRLVSENLNLATFSSPLIELAMYYTPEDNSPAVLLSNLMCKKSFHPDKLPTLSGATEIRFQPIHPAASRISNAAVVSLTRAAAFEGGEKFIYIESRSTFPEALAELSELQRMRYDFLQTDMDGLVRYSTAEGWPEGSAFDFGGLAPGSSGVGRGNGYVWGVSGEVFGAVNVLLVPEGDYDRQIDKWKTDIAFAGLVAAGLVFFVSRSLYTEFYAPLNLLCHEMERFGGGDLSTRSFAFQIGEYDFLFRQFNRLKEEIARLLAEARRKEKEKMRLELDKLYYQMNPHFLMNALNSAHWQAVMEGRGELAGYLQNLNCIMGYAMGKVMINTTIATELQVTRAYIALQQTRHDFACHMDVEDGPYLERASARMLLQPIAENAVCHNLDDFGNLWVTARDEGTFARIVIRDDGAGFDVKAGSFREPPETGGEREVSRGIGLRYVWLSLEAFYQGRAAMEIESEIGRGTTVTLELPYSKDEEGRA